MGINLSKADLFPFPQSRSSRVICSDVGSLIRFSAGKNLFVNVGDFAPYFTTILQNSENFRRRRVRFEKRFPSL
jgi:hypothetical protein